MSTLTLMGAGPELGTAFNPASVTGLHAWYKPETLGGNGTAVSSWTDSSGGGRNAVQATGSKQPLVTTGSINGLSAVTFDGVDDILIAAVTATTTRTLFIVAKQGSSVSAQRAVGFGANLAAFASVTNNWQYGTNEATSFVDLGVLATTYQVLCVRFNGTTSADWFVGAGAGTNFDPADAYNSTTLQLSSGDAINNFWNGPIAEVLLYNAAISESDRTGVRDYLKAKFAL